MLFGNVLQYGIYDVDISLFQSSLYLLLGTTQDIRDNAELNNVKDMQISEHYISL